MDAHSGSDAPPPEATQPAADAAGAAGDASGPEPGTSLARSSALMAAGTLVSRVLGFVRAALLAGVLTLVASSANAFDVANKIPNNLYMLVAGGVLNAVLVPQIARSARHEDGGQEYVDRLLTVALLVLGVVTVAVTAAAPLLVRLFSAGWDGELLGLATAFAFWCLPQVFLYGLYTLLGQVLNARGSFGPYMWAPALNNVVAILGLVVFAVVFGTGAVEPGAWTPGMVALLAGTATLGVAAQALVLLVPLRRMGFSYRPRLGLRGSGLGTAGRVAAWTFAALLVGQLGFVVTSRVTTFAGEAGDGAAGNFVYTTAYLLFMLPHSLVAVSLVTALFTRISRSAAEGDLRAVVSDLSWGLRVVGVATVLSVAALVVLADPLMRVLFPGNPASETESLAAVTVAMVLGLPAFSALYLLQRVFYALEDARTPFVVQLAVVSVSTVLNLLVWRLLPPDLLVVGVGAAMSAGFVVGAVLAAVLLRRRLGALDARRVLFVHLRLVAAAALAALLAAGVSSGVFSLVGTSRLGALLALVCGGLVLLVSYLGGCHVLGVDEVSDVLRLVRRRLGRRAA